MVMEKLRKMLGRGTKRVDLRDMEQFLQRLEQLHETLELQESLDLEMLSSARSGDAGRVRELMGRGANASAVNAKGTTALIMAASSGHEDVARLLLARGARANAGNESGRTALIEAASNGHTGVVRLLLDQGAAVNPKDEWGRTALMVAAEGNRVDIVRLLISNGASVHTSNRNGETAAQIAAVRGHLEVVRILAPFVKTSQRKPRRRSADAVAAASSRQLPWRIPPFEIQLLDYVNAGNVGGDYRAKWLDADVVVKLFVPDASTASFTDEVSLWQQLRHPNIIKLYGACDYGDLQAFVCEYASNGSLDEYLDTCGSDRQLTAWKLLHQAALGLELLHERRVVHGDLRCRNILVGSDGDVKLANFGLSRSTRGDESIRRPIKSSASTHWQSPECLEGGEPSFASDVYSLGVCIVEALSGEPPRGVLEPLLLRNRRESDSLSSLESFDDDALLNLDDDAQDLLLRMCCNDPEKRPGISAVVYELERLVTEEEIRQGHSSRSRLRDSPSTIVSHNNGDTMKQWHRLQSLAKSRGGDTLLRQELEGVSALYQHLRVGSHRSSLLKRFHELLVDLVSALRGSEPARVVQLSATRATTHSLHAFHRRIRMLWRMLSDSAVQTHAIEERWADQRDRQIEFFVSEVSKTWLLLNELESAEERSAFLAFLRDEMENKSSIYSVGQLAIMQQAYDEVASLVGPDVLAMRAPVWFIPWYELHVDEMATRLGKGGFGTVHQAKWLDSDVVVKKVLCGNKKESRWSVMSSASEEIVEKSQVLEDTAAKATRAEVMEMFKREADIWFGLSHPHIVRLFGACHVGKPFFVCEYATNGTLVGYIRKHPDDMWRLLLEAALGVQYLHARGIVHGDLKGNNVVIGSDMKAKVTDFGLSSLFNPSGASGTLITGAWHWVAPECVLVEHARPTFASDVFSLGMCVIEAMRVMDVLQLQSSQPNAILPPTYPWEELDNAVVKYRVMKGELPKKPQVCSDIEWDLIKQMCCHDPTKRMKISTVVDKMASLVSAAERRNDRERSAGSSVIGRRVQRWSFSGTVSISRMIRSSKKDLNLRGNVGVHRWLEWPRNHRRPHSLSDATTHRVYRLLWQRLGGVYAEVSSKNEKSTDGLSCLGALYLLVRDARDETKALKTLDDTLAASIEAKLKGFALHRALDKFISANFLSAANAADAFGAAKS